MEKKSQIMDFFVYFLNSGGFWCGLLKLCPRLGKIPVIFTTFTILATDFS